MRVNVYAEEMTERVELVSKQTPEGDFVGVRFYLELPVKTNGLEVRGPFHHKPDDDDSAAVTFWGKRQLRVMLNRALDLLDQVDRQKTVHDFNQLARKAVVAHANDCEKKQ